MIVLWIAAFLAMAAAAALILLYSFRPVAVVADPAQTVYLRQLAENDELAARGLMGEEERSLANAEAARRALKEKSDTAEAGPSNLSRMIVVGSIALVGVAALGIYVAVGTPDMADQPYKLRLKGWSEQPIETLSPAQIAALLGEQAKKNANEPEFLRIYAQMQEESGDSLSAVRNLEKSLAIDPASAQAWNMLGQLYARLAEGEVTPQARAALSKALELDPKAVAPRYLIGKSEVEAGRRAEGLMIWRSLLADLGPQQQEVLMKQIAEVEGGGGPVPSQAAADPAIVAMVDRLAARLKENPDDPAGWARLVRSYKVLGDDAKLNAALADARVRFKGRPRDLAAIEAATAAPQ